MRKLIITICLLTICYQAPAQKAGDLDSTFGTNGITMIGSYCGATSVAIQKDGKIVTTGGIYSTLGVIRLTTNGSLDMSFNGSGIDTATIPGYSYAGANCIAIQPDNKIIAAGSAYMTLAHEDVIAARFEPNGGLDTSFNGIGSVATIFSHYDDECHAIALQPDGKIILGGGSSSKLTGLRYNMNGSLDTTFGNEGKIGYPSTDGAYAYAALLQPDGKMILAGYADEAEFLLLRYTAYGIPDSTFGNNGVVRTQVDTNSGYSAIYAATLLPDGKILAAGSEGTIFSGAQYFALACYNSNGTLDSTFGNNGITITPESGGQAWAIAVQSDNKIIIAGRKGSTFALLRYEPNGLADTTFGNKGLVLTNIYDYDDNIYGMALQSDGKIVVAGYTTDTTGGNQIAKWTVARYLAEAPSNVVKVIKDYSIQLFPNPTNGVFTIAYKGISGSETIVVTDMMGREVKRVPCNFNNSGQIAVDMGECASGIYNVRVVGDKGVNEVLRLTKE